ncbi:hypothetical protein HPB50_013042 [Hyalomma asiaticum]|uniref:Uncharacterized protein n=1 Tax=Hyalomma asiaticum TaxID=266040 RepID=A0ACB7S3E3_HYAAI|nr:hypothetical protein HPB50_013042 [Hyalomma asiaticum]
MNAPVRRTRIAMAVTCCCLAWNCLCLLLRSQPWSRETFGVAEKSELVSVNVVIDFVYATNAASDILLIWAIYYVPLYARDGRPSEMREVNITPGALIGSEAQKGFRFWTPLALFTAIAFVRVAVLLYCFVGYLHVLSEAASDSIFDTPVDVIPSSTVSLSSVPATPSMWTAGEHRASSKNTVQDSTTHVPQANTGEAETTAHNEATTPKRQGRKTKRGVAATPTLSSLSEGVVLRVVPGPAFKRPSYVCSVSPPNMRHSRHDDGGGSDEDTPSSGAPASFDAIQAATLASIFGPVPWAFGGGRLRTLAIPALDSPENRLQSDVARTNSIDAPPDPVGERVPKASRSSPWACSEKDVVTKSAVVETPPPSPAGEATIAGTPSQERATRHERRRKGKRIAFGSLSRRGGRRAIRASATPSMPAILPARSKCSDKDVIPLDDILSTADEPQRRVGDEDDIRDSDPGSATSTDWSSEVTGSMPGASRRAASPLVAFVFCTPPSTATAAPEDVAKSSALIECARHAFTNAPPVVEKREQAVQTDIC